MRQPPDFKPPQVETRDDPAHALRERSYVLLTPLFGGGATPGVADPLSVVRVPEVRGQLRFWWRACRAGRYDSVAELAAAETALWGNTELDSPIKIELIDDKSAASGGEPEVAFTVVKDDRGRPSTQVASGVAPYGAFPLLPDKKEQKQIGWKSEEVWQGVRFKLGLRYDPKHANDVELALWAWETFGGLGARTRRGFGAVHLLSSADLLSSRSLEAERELKGKLKRRCLEQGTITSVPVLTPQMRIKVTEPFSDPIAAWKHLLSKLQAFRQSRYKKFGLSRWPEANEIRRLHGKSYKLPEEVAASRLVQSFPRAAFGLPINFHMPHDPGVPEDLVLEGQPDEQNHVKYDRLASRLILRPVACKDGKYAGLAIVLEGPAQPPLKLRLKGARDEPQVSMDLDQAEARKIDPLHSEPDVLQAFLNTL